MGLETYTGKRIPYFSLFNRANFEIMSVLFYYIALQTIKKFDF